MTVIFKKTAFASLFAAALLLASCMTVNRLDWYDIQGARLAVEMRTPPAPQLDVDYNVTLDGRNPIYSALSVMTNLAKDNQAERASAAMRGALYNVDVPEIIRSESFLSCASALGAEPVYARRAADYILALDIHDWGIEARSAGSPVTLHIRLSASLYRSFTDEMVWRRDISVSQSASPAMFGMGQIVDTMVTTTALSNMTEQELASGFRELALQSARKVARALERDLDASRYGR